MPVFQRTLSLWVLQMMLGEPHPLHQTVYIRPPPLQDDPNHEMKSPVNYDADPNFGRSSSYYPQEPFTDLNSILFPTEEGEKDADFDVESYDGPVDSFSGDYFRMFEFKVKKCARGSSHDWTQCPYAHPGEKARRRDLRKHRYSGTTCPEFRKGNCKKGDLCEFAHGVFESWLHPARYRTQPCKDGTRCRRRVCFFAHTPDQLRALPEQNSSDGLPTVTEASSVSAFPFLVSQLSLSPLTTPTESPPLSPMSRSLGSMKEVTSSLRSLQLYKVKSLPSSRNVQVGRTVFGSPTGSIVRNGYFSLPTTPTGIGTFTGIRYLDSWEEHFEEEPVMERVESGKDLRAKMYEKLKKENSLDRSDPSPSFDQELNQIPV